MTERELLLTAILKCQRADLYSARPVLTEEQRQRISYYLSLRTQGVPLQYILGETEFFGFRFKVDKRALIPRPETEILVEAVIRRTKDDGRRILDIGTGSGCIAVALAKSLPGSRVTALDISCEALALARENALINEVSDKINFICSDQLSAVSWPEGRGWASDSPSRCQMTAFDIIVSNPPYVCSKEIENLSAEVRNEPRLALDGGQDGLDFYLRILPQASGLLKENGLLFLEIGFSQRPGIEEIIDRCAGLRLKEVIKDYSGIERVMVLEQWIN